MSEIGVESLGQTAENRDIWVYKVNHEAEKTIGIDCGRSARDWLSISFCLELIDRLSAGKHNDVNWIVVPVVNPDGYQYTITTDRQWNKNRKRHETGQLCAGTDLNKNFPWQWDKLGDNPCSTDYPGPNGASEAETMALIEMIDSHLPDAYLSITTFGQLVTYPFDYDK